MVRNTTQMAHMIRFDFGENTSADLKRDREFIALARAEIASGNSIAYLLGGNIDKQKRATHPRRPSIRSNRDRSRSV
jgi:hypothetical protein